MNTQKYKFLSIKISVLMRFCHIYKSANAPTVQHTSPLAFAYIVATVMSP